ncbi:MAG TPA: preprotein translocase subunit SecG [Tianweitania sediminis]|jgi:preprotein translocase subunit SecG|nr:preprotein translocase subunit SecG [Tianweitania sediminis]
MQTILIVIHLLVVLALVAVVLLQRSEGGGLGIGGGSGFMTARGAANALTRTTAILATAFFVTSLALSIVARYYGDNPLDILDRLPNNQPGQTQPVGGGGNGVLDQLGGSATPAAPATITEPTPAPVTPPSGDVEPVSAAPAQQAPAAQPPADAGVPSGQ